MVIFKPVSSDQVYR